MTGIDYEHRKNWRFEPPANGFVSCYRVRPARIVDREGFRAIVRRFRESLPDGDSITILSINEVDYKNVDDLDSMLDDMPKKVNLIHVQSGTALVRLAWYETRVEYWNNSQNGRLVHNVCTVLDSHSRGNRFSRINGQFRTPSRLRARVMRWRSRDQIERRMVAVMSGVFGFLGGLVAVVIREVIA